MAARGGGEDDDAELAHEVEEELEEIGDPETGPALPSTTLAVGATRDVTALAPSTQRGITAEIVRLGIPVTGIAIDPVLGIMWMTSVPGAVIGVAPIPGTPVIVPAFVPAVPFGAPVSGLDWDSISGSLFSALCTLLGRPRS